jgi:hypothetical protein
VDAVVGNTAYAGLPAALVLSPPKTPSLSITYGLISTLYSEPGTVLERSDPWLSSKAEMPQPQATKKPPLRVAFSSPAHGVINSRGISWSLVE